MKMTLVLSWFLSSGPLLVAFSESPTLEQFRFDGDQNLYDENHLRVASGKLSVGVPLMDALSVGSLFSAPWAASDFSLEFLVNGKALPLESFTWHPHKVVRTGKTEGIRVRSTLLPLRQSRAFIHLIRFESENRQLENRHLEVSMRAHGTLDRAGPKQWSYSAPESSTPLKVSVRKGSGGDDDLYSLILELKNSQGEIQAALISSYPQSEGTRVFQRMTLIPEVPRELKVLVVLGDDAEYRRLRSRFDQTLQSNLQNWSKFLQASFSRLPRLETDDPDLESFYYRGALTLLTNRWDLDSLVTRPYYGEAGIDGGALCAYLWGYGYTAEFFSLTQPVVSRAMIEHFLAMDMTRFFAYSPLDGSGIGRWYAYNNYSIVRFAYHYVMSSGDVDFLNELVSGKTVLQWLTEIAEWPGKDEGGLVDYGFNDNLLELQLTEEYQHFVPSPNAERAESMRMVFALSEMAGRPTQRLLAQAKKVDDLVLDKLWNPDAKWMSSLDEAGQPHLSYSIQVFDLLRLDSIPRTVKEGLVSHLNEREFLSDLGVHSLSKLDAGYDERDVDWGGPGVYVGDGPELIEDLYKAGFPARAEELLRRILWWGDRFPYYPQAIRSDRVDYRHDGFSGCIAGLAVPQAIVFGVFGVRFPFDSKGSLEINPHRLSFLQTQILDDLRWRHHRIRISVEEDSYNVQIDGRSVKRPLGKALQLQP